MDIRQALLKEHSKKQAHKIAAYVGSDKKRFDDLMKLFLGNEYRVTQRAAWIVGISVQKNPSLAKNYFKTLIALLDAPGAHPAVTRNIVRILQFIEIPKKFHGRLMDICFRFVSTPETAVAVKVFSLSILENLSTKYPEIKQELKLLIEETWPNSTAAFKSRARKILKSLQDF